MKAKKGFNLVELVVVIAILAVLSALVLPNFKGLTKQSKDTVCHTNLLSFIHEYESQVALDSGADFATGDPTMDNTIGPTDVTMWCAVASEDTGISPGTININGNTGTGTLTCQCGNEGTIKFTSDFRSIEDIVCSVHGSCRTE